MDYIEIVLTGYIENNIKYLKNHFFREFKKAEKGYYSAKEFFDGCQKVTNNFLSNIQIQYNQRRFNYLEQIEEAKKSGFKSDSKNCLMTEDEMRNSYIEILVNELNNININEFSVDLKQFTDSDVDIKLFNDDVLRLDDAIKKAYNEINAGQKKVSIKKKQGKKAEKPPKPPPTFIELFRNPDHAQEVKDILETTHYTKNGIWVSDGAQYSLAKIFYMLRESDYGLHIIKKGNQEDQLSTLYLEFGYNKNDFITNSLTKAKTSLSQYDEIYTHLHPYFSLLGKKDK